MPSRDDFSKLTKETLAKRVGFRCSNPKCKKLTSGPQTAVTGVTNIGVAAHITAAAFGGPRYNASISEKQRASIVNGIWLCQSCAKLIDSDTSRYSSKLLNKWKHQAEESARIQLESSTSFFTDKQVAMKECKYTRVLLPEANAARQFSGGNAYGVTTDYSVYPFLVEELVSVGVSQIAVVSGTGQAEMLPVLSNFMKDRIVIIDPSINIKQVSSLFDPIADELGATFQFPPVPTYGVSVTRDKPISNKATSEDKICTICAQLYPDFFKLVLGMQYELEIEFDIIRAKQHLLFLRDHLRSREARDLTAILSGVLSNYEEMELDTLEFITPAHNSFRKVFEDLLNDSNYRNMSQSSYGLGVAACVDEAKKAFAASAQKVNNNSKFAGVFRQSSRKIQVARSTSNLASQASVSEDMASYMPPILPFNSVRKRAQETWLRVKPAPIPSHTPPKNIAWGELSIFGED